MNKKVIYLFEKNHCYIGIYNDFSLFEISKDEYYKYYNVPIISEVEAKELLWNNIIPKCNMISINKYEKVHLNDVFYMYYTIDKFFLCVVNYVKARDTVVCNYISDNSIINDILIRFKFENSCYINKNIVQEILTCSEHELKISLWDGRVFEIPNFGKILFNKNFLKLDNIIKIVITPDKFIFYDYDGLYTFSIMEKNEFFDNYIRNNFSMKSSIIYIKY